MKNLASRASRSRSLWDDGRRPPSARRALRTSPTGGGRSRRIPASPSRRSPRRSRPAVVLQLIEEGKLKLDEHVAPLLPGLRHRPAGHGLGCCSTTLSDLTDSLLQSTDRSRAPVPHPDATWMDESAPGGFVPTRPHPSRQGLGLLEHQLPPSWVSWSKAVTGRPLGEGGRDRLFGPLDSPARPGTRGQRNRGPTSAWATGWSPGHGRRRNLVSGRPAERRDAVPLRRHRRWRRRARSPATAKDTRTLDAGRSPTAAKVSSTHDAGGDYPVYASYTRALPRGSSPYGLGTRLVSIDRLSGARPFSAATSATATSSCYLPSVRVSRSPC